MMAAQLGWLLYEDDSTIRVSWSCILHVQLVYSRTSFELSWYLTLSLIYTHLPLGLQPLGKCVYIGQSTRTYDITNVLYIKI